jgi:hypothetical protein
MKKLFHPSALLLYLLAILVFFVVGAMIAGVAGAGKNQGLAGGAIVFGYGILSAGLSLIAGLLFAYLAERKYVVLVNKILFLLLLICGCLVAYRIYTKQQQNSIGYNVSPEQFITAPARVTYAAYGSASEAHMGLGFFAPHFANQPVLYFYSKPNNDKPVEAHVSYDSIVFMQTQYGSFDIAYAPPWLVPDHLKLDYDLCYFKVVSVGRDFAEVVVNVTNAETAYVALNAGKLLYWPEFLLSVHSVEFIAPQDHVVRIKPLSHASAVVAEYAFMRPVMIQHDWMEVDLWDEDFNSVGHGWIQWKQDGQLLIMYSLLS